MFETLQRLRRLSSFKADQAVHNCTTRVLIRLKQSLSPRACSCLSTRTRHSLLTMAHFGLNNI